VTHFDRLLTDLKGNKLKKRENKEGKDKAIEKRSKRGTVRERGSNLPYTAKI